MPLDSETKNHLEDVRRGKPRNFVMLCKGVKILGMMLYKIGSLETYKKKVKEAGAGSFYHGLVDGQGENITFYLRRGDGFEKPPTKEQTLKEFLKTEAGMKFKPGYDLVEAFPASASGEEEGLAGWRAARSDAVATLKQVAKQIALAKHRDSAAAILEIKAVIAKLDESPETQQQATELERYLSGNKMVQNIDGIGESLCGPLLKQLAVLKPQLPA